MTVKIMPAAKAIEDEEILRVFRESDDPVLTAGEIGDHIGLTGSGVTYRLNQLHDRGVVGKKKAGARAVVWWLDG